MAVGFYQGSKIDEDGKELTGRSMMRGRNPDGRLDVSAGYQGGKTEQRIQPRKLSRNRGRGSHRS